MEKLWNYDDNSLIFIAKSVNMQFEVYLLLNRAILHSLCFFILIRAYFGFQKSLISENACVQYKLYY